MAWMKDAIWPSVVPGARVPNAGRVSSPKEGSKDY